MTRETTYLREMIMNFQKQTGDVQGDGVWYSGIYKIVRYNRHLDNDHRPAYNAYYKPKGWKNWGNRVDRKTLCYRTLKQAKAACEVHSIANV